MNRRWDSIIKPTGIPITATQVQDFEDRLGVDLPEAYRRFLLHSNGGRVVTPHDIYVPQIGCNIGVNYLWPLTNKSPFLGVVEARQIQLCQRRCLKHSLAIADDMGTGFYYLILVGAERGGIYFVWKDDQPIVSPSAWDTWEVELPECMVLVATDFDRLGELILANANR